MQKIEREKFYRNSYELLDGLITLLLSLPPKIRHTPAIELGSYIGESASILSLFFDELHCVDPLEDEKTKASFIKNTEGRNIYLVSKKTDDAVGEFPESFFSLVYIDAVHTYDAVKKDILNYYSKVIPGGYVGGHDYYDSDGILVKKAVDEMFGEPDFVFTDTSWLVKKTPGRLKNEGH